jgi:kynurenine 3-monooxygenase
MKIAIVGAGPAGILMAHYLIRRPNYEVHVYEKRGDPRQTDNTRTFPIGLQSRGLAAIRKIDGLEDALEQTGVWLSGAYLYRKAKGFRISGATSLNLGRNDIASVMMQELLRAKPATNSSIALHFDSTLEKLDLDNKVLMVNQRNSSRSESFDGLVAADGARSQVRQQLAEMGELKFEADNIPDQYKSIYSARKSADGSFMIEPGCINGWMKGTVRVIMVPLKEDSCSGAFVFKEGEDPFSHMESAEAVQDYFNEMFPETLAKIITLKEAEDLIKRPVSTLLSVKCDRMTVKDCVLLIGDSAHAVSASVGQGCNSALQDVMIFGGCLDQNNDDWCKALPAFNAQRLPDAHALRDISDYSTPRTAWMRVESFLRLILKKILPKWLSKFMKPMPMTLISTTDLSYSEVLERTRWWTDRVKKSQTKEKIA